MAAVEVALDPWISVVEMEGRIVHPQSCLPVLFPALELVGLEARLGELHLEAEVQLVAVVLGNDMDRTRHLQPRLA